MPRLRRAARVRQFLETIEELGVAAQHRGRGHRLLHVVCGHRRRRSRAGAARSRASVATGVKRMLPDALVFTLQGDGDMVNEGLQEVLHTGAPARR